MNMQNLLLFFILFLAEMVSAQPAIEWQKSLGGSYFDEAYSVDQTLDGGYILTGLTASIDGDVFGNHGSADCWVVKLNAGGVLEWKKAFGGSSIDSGQSIKACSDGGYIVAGYTDSNNWQVSGNHGERDAWVVKLDAMGNIQWQRCYGGSKWEEAFSIQPTADGGYVFTGYAESNDGDLTENQGDFDAWIIKIDAIGAIEWQRTYGGTREDRGSSIVLTREGGYIVTGKTRSQDGDVSSWWGGDDFWVLKLNMDGKLEWEKTYGANGLQIPLEIIETADGGYIMTGNVTGGTIGQVSDFKGGIFDAWVVRINSAGELMWQKTLGGSEDDYGRSIIQTEDGGYIVCGGTDSMDGDMVGNDGGYDVFLIKLNDLGEILWQKTIGGTLADDVYSIRQTTDKGYVLAGANWSSDGDATSSNGYNDFWIVKLSPESTATTHPQTQALDVFPNPGTGLVTLQIPPEETIFNLQLIDLQGRIIHEENGSNTTFDLSPFPKGSYLLSARSENGQMWVGKIQKK